MCNSRVTLGHVPHRRLPQAGRRPGGTHGLSSRESARPDRAGRRRPQPAGAERHDRPAGPAQAGRAGRLHRHPQRVPYRRPPPVGSSPARAPAARPAPGPAAAGHGLFDLTPTEDEQMLVDVVGRVRRGGGAARRRRGRRGLRAPPSRCSQAASRSGCRSSACPRRSAASPRSARRWPAPSSPRRSPTATWAWPSPPSRPARWPPRSALWGTDAQQQTYLPAFTGDDVPAAALALTEPTVLFDPLSPATTARRDGDGFVLDGLKSAVVAGRRGRALRRGRRARGRPVLFLVESSADGPDRRGRPVDGRARRVA